MIYHELYRLLVVQYRMVSHDYFMHTMELWEAGLTISNLQYADTNSWEQTRALMTMLANMFSKKKLSAEEIMKLPWDHRYEAKNTAITNEEIEELRNKAQKIASRVYGRSNTDKADK